MKAQPANSYRITQFKKELWVDMSNSCDPHFWSYSKSEKRLFTILSVLLVSLSLFYFNSYRNQNKVVREQIEQYASSNAASLKRLQSATAKERAPSTEINKQQLDTSITPTQIITNDLTDKTNQQTVVVTPTAIPTQPVNKNGDSNNKSKLDSVKKDVNSVQSSSLLDTNSLLNDSINNAENSASNSLNLKDTVSSVTKTLLQPKENKLQLPK